MMIRGSLLIGGFLLLTGVAVGQSKSDLVDKKLTPVALNSNADTQVRAKKEVDGLRKLEPVKLQNRGVQPVPTQLSKDTPRRKPKTMPHKHVPVN